MKYSIMLTSVLAVLLIALVIIWGCQNQTTSPVASENTQQSGLKPNFGGSSGTNGGYYWGVYTQGSGTYSVSFPDSKSIKCTWSSGFNDIGVGKGWKPGSVKTVQYHYSNQSGSVNSIGIYGWTRNPLVEYYMTQRGSHGGTSLGTMSSYGFTYNCYKQQRVNAPSIEGTKTFWQYKNSRQSGAGSGGTITCVMSDHVNFWKSKGLSWGSSVYDTMVEFEAFSGPGSIQLTIH
jgi:endo-1,4-beta-xylanase